MLGKVACRTFHVVSMAGKVWLHSLPSCKWSEQLFYLKHGLKSQVYYGKTANQGETRPRATLGGHLFSLKVFAMGWTEILMLAALGMLQLPRMLVKDCMNTIQVICTHAA